MAIKGIIHIQFKESVDAKRELLEGIANYHKNHKPSGFGMTGIFAKDVRRAIVQFPSDDNSVGEAAVIVAEKKKDLLGIRTIEQAKHLCVREIVSIETASHVTTLHSPKAPAFG